MRGLVGVVYERNLLNEKTRMLLPVHSESRDRRAQAHIAPLNRHKSVVHFLRVSSPLSKEQLTKALKHGISETTSTPVPVRLTSDV